MLTLRQTHSHLEQANVVEHRPLLRIYKIEVRLGFSITLHITITNCHILVIVL